MPQRRPGAASTRATVTITTPLGLKQQRSLAQSTVRVNLWHGSIRAGKTFVSFLRFVTAIALYEGPGSYVMVGKSRDSLWRNVFEPLQRDPHLAFLRGAVQYNQGATHAVILGMRVNVLGANDVTAESVIRGMTVGLAYGDEVTVWQGDVFKTLLGRMSPDQAQLFATTNPDNPAHWLKRDYLDKLSEHPDWRVWHFTMADNPGLSPAYIRFIRASYSGLWWKRFGLGLWVSAEGAIFPEWDERRHVVPWSKLPRMERFLGIGIDYGTTNPTSCILLGVSAEVDEWGRPAPKLYLIDEWRYDSSESLERLSPSAQSALFRAWLAEDHLPHGMEEPRVEFIFRDPAAAEFGETLADDGVTAWLADNAVKQGIQDVANLLASGRLLVSTRCKGFIGEAPGYVWDPKKTAKGRDEPLKERDHSCDAVRYIVRSTRMTWSGILQDAYGAAAVAA